MQMDQRNSIQNQQNRYKKISQVQNIDQQTDQLTYGTQLSYEQKENIKLLSSKFVNKYVKAQKRNYSTLFWNLRIITIRDNKFKYYKLDRKYDELFIQGLRKKEEMRLRQQNGESIVELPQQLQKQQEEPDKMEVLPESLNEEKGMLIQKGEILMTDITRVQWPSDEQAEDPRQRLILYFPKNKMTLYDSHGYPIKNDKEKGETYWMFELGNFMRDDHRERIEREKRLEEDKKKKERKRQDEEEKKKKEQQDKKKTAEQREEEQKKIEEEEKKKVKQEQEEKQQEEMTKRQRETSQQNQEEKQKNQEKIDKQSLKRDEKLLEQARKKIENSYEYYYNLLQEEQYALFKVKNQKKDIKEQLKNQFEQLRQKYIQKKEQKDNKNQNTPKTNEVKTQFDVNDITQQLNMKLIELVGHFRRKCTSNFQKIITQMVLPQSLQQYQKIESNNKNYSQWLWLKEEGEDLYIVNNIIFRVSKFHNYKESNDQEVYFNDYLIKCMNNEFRANRILSDILFNLRREYPSQLQVPLTCIVEYLGFRALCISMPPIANIEPVHGPNYFNERAKQSKQINRQNSTQVDTLVNTLQDQDKQVVYKEEPNLDQDLSDLAKILNLKHFTFKSKEQSIEIQTDKRKKVENIVYKDVKIHLSIFNEIYEMKETPQWTDTIKQLQKNIQFIILQEEYQQTQDQELLNQLNYQDENTSFANIKKILNNQLKEKDDLKKPEQISDVEDDIKWVELIQDIIIIHKKTILNNKNRRNDTKYYLMKNSNLFPVMFQGKGTFDFSKQFRPEFLSDFAELPMSNGAFINPTSKNELSEDDRLCAEYSKSIVELMIPQLLQKLENLQQLIYDSQSIAEAFHQVSFKFQNPKEAKIILIIKQFGINLRFMGVAYKMTNFPHIKDLLHVEMIARSLKKIYRWWMGKAIEQFNKENENTYDLENNGKSRAVNDKDDNEGTEEDMTIINQKPFLLNFEPQINKATIDFLNLIFGFNPNITLEQQQKYGRKIDEKEALKSEECKVFWNNWIAPQVQMVLADFDHNIGVFPQNIPIAQGSLLNAVLYHLRIRMQYEIQSLQLFRQIDPFDKNKITNICFSKCYDFPTLPIKIFSKKWKQYRQGNNPILTQQSLLLDLKIEEALKDKNNQSHITSNEFMIYTDLMENSFKRAIGLSRQKQQNSNQKVDYFGQVQWFLQQSIIFGDPAKDNGSIGTIGFAKYYVLMMKISYNRVLFYEKQKRQIEKDMLRIIKNTELKDESIKEIDKIIEKLQNGDEIKKQIGKNLRDTNTNLEKIKYEIVKIKPESIIYFEKAQEVVKFNLGEYHFLFASLYCQCKEVQKPKDQSILTLFLSALTCCTRILGNNHIQTAEVCQDLSEFIYNFDDKRHQESLNYYEKALLIYEAVYGNNSFKVANMCYQLGRRYFKLADQLRILLFYLLSVNTKLTNQSLERKKEIRQ